MHGLRHHIQRYRGGAIGLLALALVLKMLVPAGFMVGTAHGRIMFVLCSGTGPQTMTMAMPGMEHRADGREGRDRDGHDKAAPCPFSVLSTASLAAADPVLLAAAIMLLFATAFRIARRPTPCVRRHHLRPPLRGPPPGA